ARPLAARRVDGRAPAGRSVAPAGGRRAYLARQVRAARLDAPADGPGAAPPRGSPDGGDPALRQQALPHHARPRPSVAAWPRAAGSVVRDDLLRRARGDDLPAHGPPAEAPFRQLVRPGSLLER